MATRLQRRAAIWFGMAGVWALVASLVHALSDPAYYEAESLSDYVAVVSLTAVFVATGVGLVTLWFEPIVKRGSLFVLLAGIGAISEGLGNLLEDAFGVEAAVWAFFGGGLLMMLSLLIAGVAALTDGSPGRWSGGFLLFALPGGMLGFGAVMMAVSWILFGFWIVLRQRGFVVALAGVTLPAIATSTYLYL